MLLDGVMVYAVRSDSDKKLLRSKHGKTLKGFFLLSLYEKELSLKRCPAFIPLISFHRKNVTN
jgi:hypothetical protein